MKRKIAVIGVGTAGLTSLSHCLSQSDPMWEVVSISDPSIPILGIGESTTNAIPANLFYGARFSLLRDADLLDATVKHGVKYVDWRDHDIFSRIAPPTHGIHFNNFKLKEFCFIRFKEIWKDKFLEIYGKIEHIDNNDTNVSITIDNEVLKFDYVIDCRGYPEDYTDYTISTNIPVNHCLVHTIKEPGNWNYTYHVAHRNGWMFGIPLKTRQGWGYLYNDNITSREDAVDDISDRFKLKKEDLTLREFSFKNYYANKFIDGRIIKNGNRALFFEPIEAMSGVFYDYIMNAITPIIRNQEFNTDKANNDIIRFAKHLETLNSFIYHGGSTFKSEFWTTTVTNANLQLSNDALFNLYKYRSLDHSPFNGLLWLDLDKGFSYNYFTNSNDSKEW